jgi:hypothetical protein
MKTYLVLAAALLLGLLAAAAVNAQSPTPLRDRALAKARVTEAGCREILEANFAAFNAKDLDGFIGTIHPYAAGKYKNGAPKLEKIAELREETKKLFEEATIYLRVVDFHVRSTGNPAFGTVVQETVAYDDVSNEYRHRSALVPSDRYVVYTQQFMLQGDKWMMGPIKSVPAPVSPEQLQSSAQEQANCPNGQCRPLSVRLSVR